MRWHFEATRFTARLYKPGTSYEEGDPFVAVAQIDRRRNGKLYVHAALVSGAQLSMVQWRRFARQALQELGAKLIEAEIDGNDVAIEPSRAKRG